MANNQMTAEFRTTAGKGVARKLRASGRIPGVFYGNGEGPISIHLDPAELNRVLTESDAGMNTLIDLSIVGNGSDLAPFPRALSSPAAWATSCLHRTFRSTRS